MTKSAVQLRLVKRNCFKKHRASLKGRNSIRGAFSYFFLLILPVTLLYPAYNVQKKIIKKVNDEQVDTLVGNITDIIQIWQENPPPKLSQEACDILANASTEVIFKHDDSENFVSNLSSDYSAYLAQNFITPVSIMDVSKGTETVFKEELHLNLQLNGQTTQRLLNGLVDNFIYPPSVLDFITGTIGDVVVYNTATSSVSAAIRDRDNPYLELKIGKTGKFGSDIKGMNRDLTNASIFSTPYLINSIVIANEHLEGHDTKQGPCDF